MAKQQIQLQKVKFVDRLTDPQNPRALYRPGIKTQAVINSDKLIENICNHSGQKRGQVVAVLAALPDAVKDYATAGHAVQIDGLVTIKPLIHVRAVDTPEQCTADTIKSVTLRAYPIGETAALVKKYNFRMVERIVNGNASDDDGGVDEPNTGNGGNQQTGGNTQPTQEPVTYTFKYHDDTEDSRSGLPGAAVDAPEPDEGYRWNEAVPSVFGNANKTFTEVADTQGGGGTAPTETPTDPTKILLLFNDGAHNNVILKRMEVEPGYQLQTSDLPEGYVYAFKSDDQADINAATAGEAVWVTLTPRS